MIITVVRKYLFKSFLRLIIITDFKFFASAYQQSFNRFLGIFIAGFFFNGGNFPITIYAFTEFFNIRPQQFGFFVPIPGIIREFEETVGLVQIPTLPTAFINTAGHLEIGFGFLFASHGKFFFEHLNIRQLGLRCVKQINGQCPLPFLHRIQGF